MRRRELIFYISIYAIALVVGYTNASKVLRKPAAVPPRQTELEFDKIVPVKSSSTPLDQESVALFIPTRMEQTSDQKQVQNQIVEHGVQNFMRGKFIKNKEIATTVDSVQQAMKPGMSFGDPDGVQHKVDVEVQAISNVATLNYSGFFDSTIAYKERTDTLQVSLEEKLSTQTKLILEHTSDTDLSMVKINWGF